MLQKLNARRELLDIVEKEHGADAADKLRRQLWLRPVRAAATIDTIETTAQAAGVTDADDLYEPSESKLTILDIIRDLLPLFRKWFNF